jgi:hypothetical protein
MAQEQLGRQGGDAPSVHGAPGARDRSTDVIRAHCAAGVMRHAVFAQVGDGRLHHSFTISSESFPRVVTPTAGAAQGPFCLRHLEIHWGVGRALRTHSPLDDLYRPLL